MKPIARNRKGMRAMAASLVFFAAFSFAAAQETQGAATKPDQQEQAAAKSGQKTNAKDAKQADKQAKGDNSKDSTEDKPDSKLPEVSVGFHSWGDTGNRHKFLQYASPPRGLVLDSLIYHPEFNGLRYTGVIDIHAPFEDDSLYHGRILANWGRTTFEGTGYQNRFFDTTPMVIHTSERQIGDGYVRQKLGPSAFVAVRSKIDQQDQIFAAPKDPLHQRTRTWNAILQGSTDSKGYGNLQFTDWRYSDRTLIEPSSRVQRWEANYTREISPAFDLMGNYTAATIHQDGFRGSSTQVWSLGGAWDITDSTMLTGNYRIQSINVPNVQDAYVRSRQQGRLRLMQTWRNWTAELGYSANSMERVRADHTFVDNPTYHAFDAKISGSLSPNVRLTARGMRQTMQGSATMDTDDPRGLYWQNTSSAQIKLDAFWDYVSGYAIYSLQDRSNGNRGTNIHSRMLTLGADWQIRPDLGLYFENTSDWWSAFSSDPKSATLGQYFPDGNVYVVGANWNVNPTLTLTANYTEFWTNNDNPLALPDGNVRGRFLNTGLTYRFKDGYELGLVVSPWHYTDKVYSVASYDATVLAVTARIKF